MLKSIRPIIVFNSSDSCLIIVRQLLNFRPTAVGRKDFSKLENSFYLLGNLL